jgi:hypothetical protein
VFEESESRDKFKGQFIAAGFSGHGMPRTFAWYVTLAALLFSSIQTARKFSAQVIAEIIVSEITGKNWTLPEWLPRHYLTEERMAEAKKS